MPLIARQRSRLAVLAVLALVGSLLAVSAVPAVAADADEKVSAPAMYSACVAAATEDGGFSDTAGNFAEDAINCLAHYGISVGNDGAFSPNAGITRSQMALFMVRSAGVAGIEMDDPEDQGLGDIGGWTDAIQDAINQAVALEIMSGTDGNFDPSGSVDRASMAVILDNFLAAADVELDEDITPDEPFEDVGSVSFAAHGAINRLYEFGVVAGSGEGETFSPNDLVSRAQMAAFVTRALDHTNARPAGISVQAAPDEVTDNDASTLQVSLRDADHQPVPDELVEAFSAISADDAFDDEGACEDNDDDFATYGASRCVIDAADEATDPDGNVEFEVNTSPAISCPGSLSFFAWTGSIGDEYDSDETDTATTTVSVSKEATEILITSDAQEDALFQEFGDSVTVTIQVTNDDGDAVAKDDLEVEIRTIRSSGVPGTLVITSNVVKTYTTDAAGRIEITLDADDPDTEKDVVNEVSIDLDITRDTGTTTVGGLTVEDESGLFEFDANANDADPNPDAGLSWTDAKAKPTSLSISQSLSYHEASDDASGVRNTVQATLTDQYGDPVSGVKIRFWSNANNRDDDADNDGLGGLDRYETGDNIPDGSAVGDVIPDNATTETVDESAAEVPDAEDYADERTTNRRGVATKFYNRDSDAAQVEVIMAGFNLNPGDGEADGDGEDTDSDFADPGETAMLTHYWATVADDDTTGIDGSGDPVVVIDTDANLVVITSGDNVFIVKYDSNDQFTTSEGATTIAAFEAGLKVESTTPAVTASQLTASIAEDPGDGVSTFEIDTAGDPADRCDA